MYMYIYIRLANSIMYSIANNTKRNVGMTNQGNNDKGCGRYNGDYELEP